MAKEKDYLSEFKQEWNAFFNYHFFAGEASLYIGFFKYSGY